MSHFAVIGTGYWGENHARVASSLLEDGRISSLTLCDQAVDRVSEIAGRYDVEYTSDYQELLLDDLDAAVLATPSNTHYDIGLDLLENGIDLLIEKPLSLSSQHATEMVERARDLDRTLATGHIFRYHSAFQELQQRISRGELGEIRHMVTNRCAFRTPRKRAGSLHSLAVHDLDLYSLLFNRSPDQLYCQTTSFIREGIDETASITLTYGDATGVINVSWQIPVFGKRRDLVVVGSKRVAYLDYTQETVLELYDAETFKNEDGHYVSRDDGKIKVETDRYEPLKREVEDFLESTGGDQDPIASGAVGANAVYLVNRAQESAENDAPMNCQNPPVDI